MKKIIAGLLVLGIASFLPLEAKADKKRSDFAVRMVIYLPADTPNVPADVQKKLTVSANMMDQFFKNEARRMDMRARDVQFERDGNGKVVVHIVRTPKTHAQLLSEGYWGAVVGDVTKIMDIEKSIAIVFAPKGAPWVGGGVGSGMGGVALVSDFFEHMGKTETEQKAIYCDKSSAPPSEYSGLTRGELASLRMGGVVHELGHALHAKHEAEQNSLMSAGFWGFANNFTKNCVRSPKTVVTSKVMTLFQNRPFFKQDVGKVDMTKPSMTAVMEKGKVTGETSTTANAILKLQVDGQDKESGLSIVTAYILQDGRLLSYDTYKVSAGKVAREINLGTVTKGRPVTAVVHLYNGFGYPQGGVREVTY